MRKSIITFTLACLTLLAAKLHAQVPPAPATDDAAQQQMQQMRTQIFQNMAAKGINPQEFFQEIGQKMQSGSMDFADIQKVMLEKGIIDQKMVTQMQTTMQSAALNNVKRQLNATDEEWKVLQPKVSKVLTALAAASQPGQGGMMAGMMSGMSGQSPAAAAMKELRAAITAPNTSPDIVSSKLRIWRDAHEKAKSELAGAQKELTELLTVRQEAVLMGMGLIP